MDILTIIKLSIAGVVLIASAVLFLLDLRKKKGFSIFKAACIVAAVLAIVSAGVIGFRPVSYTHLRSICVYEKLCQI